MALLSLQAGAAAVGMPAHHSLLGDVVPLPIRGRFMGAGMMFNSIAAVLVLPVAGFLVARIGGLSGYQVLWLLAALAGLGATAMYWRIPEPPSEEGAATQGGPLGGGKGMRRVHHEHEVASAVRAARSEAKASFGNGSVYIE